MRAMVGLGLVLLAGCVGPTTDAPCYVNRMQWRADDENPVGRIEMLNVGRFCGLTVNNDRRGAEAVGTIVAQPEHGRARVRQNTSGAAVAEYLPQKGFVGQDSYKARLGAGSQTITVYVTVRSSGS